MTYPMKEAADALGTDRLLVVAGNVWSQATPEASIDPGQPEVYVLAAAPEGVDLDRWIELVASMGLDGARAWLRLRDRAERIENPEVRI